MWFSVNIHIFATEVMPVIVELPETPLEVLHNKNILISTIHVAPGFSGEVGRANTDSHSGGPSRHCVSIQIQRPHWTNKRQENAKGSQIFD